LKTLHEGIKPAQPNARYCSSEELDDVLLGALDAASAETPCDFDRAMLLGTKVRENKLDFEPAVVEGLVKKFLSESVTASKVEASAWFLWAYWEVDGKPDARLVNLLCEYLNTKLPYQEVQEALILCVAKVFAMDIDAGEKKRIHGIFESVSKTSQYQIRHPMVLSAMDRVLSSTEVQ